MSSKIYSEEYKWEVVKTYYTTDLGVRKTAQHFGLPTKNYVTRWIMECKNKGLIPQNATKTSFVPAEKIEPIENKSAVLKQLERENLRLRAELDLLKKVNFLRRGNVLQK